MNGFVVDENARRIGSYKKDEGVEGRFLRMNIALSKLEGDPRPQEEYPTLFIFGLPRSATTLTYQLLSQCLEIGYINNLMARFWLAPQYGIALSQSVLGSPRRAEYASDFGKTHGPYGPHEFAYFWHHWLKVTEIDDMLEFGLPRLDIDWTGLRRAVQGMQTMFVSGMVFKTVYALNHIDAFLKTFSMPLFVYVEREPEDVALSILAARHAYYGRSDAWWSTYPPNYHVLANLPFAEQIAGQVYSLRHTYERAMKLIPPEYVVRLKYPQLCEAPREVITTVQARVAEVHGFSLKTRIAPPERFEVNPGPELLDRDQQAVVAAVRAQEN